MQVASSVMDGIRILDASVGLAGPVATRWLAELGADVLKVEPRDGDPTRTSEPAGFATWNRSKSSVGLDIDDADDRARFEALLGAADVLVHGWTPARAAALDVSTRALAERHPGLVVASVTAYPVGHVDEERDGDEWLVQARLGAMDEQEALRDGPMFIRMPFASWGAAYMLAGGIAARLLERERTGIVRPIHTSLLQGALAPAALYWQRAGDPPEWLARHTLPKLDEPPHISIFQCADGRWLQVMGGFTKTEALRPALAACGASDLFGGWATTANRDRWADVFVQHTVEEWTEMLWPQGAVCMPVLEPGEVFGIEQAVANGAAVALDDPRFGPTVQAGAAFQVGAPATVRNPAPARPGEDAPRSWASPRGTPLSGAQDVPDGLPLAGVRVIDFGAYVAGPFSSQCLADFGADVIKVEPLAGEKGREINQFTGCQRGKRSLALDLRHPRRDEVLVALIASADVVVHNVRVNASRKLGIDEASLRRINPGLVFGHATGYGTEGPWRDLPAFDPTGFALSGWGHGISGPGNRPSWLRMSTMDAHTGLAGFAGVVLALLHRARTGEATSASTSLLAVAATSASETLLAGPERRPVPLDEVDAEQTGIDPYRRIFAASDGWIAVSARSEEARTAVRAVLGTDEAEFAAAVAPRTAAALLDQLRSLGVPAEPVATDNRDAFFDAELASGSGLVRRVEGTPYGWFENPGGFWSDGRTVLRNDRPIAAIGEHTREVLAELGLSRAEIGDLLRDRVVTANVIPQEVPA